MRRDEKGEKKREGNREEVWREEKREKGKQGDKVGEAVWRCQGERLLKVQRQFSYTVDVAEVAKQSLCARVLRLHILWSVHARDLEHVREVEREGMRASVLKGAQSMKHSSISKGQGEHCEASPQKPSSPFYVCRLL